VICEPTHVEWAFFFVSFLFTVGKPALEELRKPCVEGLSRAADELAGARDGGGV
jgi:hypothetical protein